MNDVATNEVVIGGGLEVGKFSIRESAKSFSILSSNLYQKKIKAIIRELACNARDSRIAAGFSEDFSIHLPTKMEPEFSIKDEGVGLSHDEVMHLYTTYFESTKNDSNQFIGALGIGSKSPFSYTENFTVTAIKDGHRGIYSAFINEVGVPSIVCMLKESTRESNGVEIKIPVKQKDHSEFYQESIEVFKWFDIKPSCNIDLPDDHSYEIKHEYYTESFSNKSIILMGGVAYEFDMVDFVASSTPIKFIFRVNIGDVDVLPSREGLQNTQKTKTAITGLYNRIVDLEQSKIELILEKIDNVYDKIAYLNVEDNALSKYIKSIIKTNKFKNAIVKFSELEKINLKCSHKSIDTKKATKSIQSAAIRPCKLVQFVYNDIGAPIKEIKTQFDTKNAFYIFSKSTKKDVVDFEKFRMTSLLGASVILASSFYVKPVIPHTSKIKSDVMSLRMLKNNRYSSYKTKYKLFLKDLVNVNGVVYYTRLQSDNTVSYNGRIVSFDSLVNMFGIDILFLKEKSKYDTTGLIDCFEHIETLISKQSKYKFEYYYGHEDFYNLILYIKKHKLTIEDSILLYTSDAYFCSKQTKNENAQLDRFLEYNSKSFKESRVSYCSETFKKLHAKYDMIKVADNTDPLLIQQLIDIVHNYK